MMRRAPKYVHGFTDRFGKARFYLRRPGFKPVPLTGLPWSPQFMADYEAAMGGEAPKGEAPRIEIGASRTKEGTINSLVVAYFKSMTFEALAAETKRTRRNILERFRAEHGDKRFGTLQRKHVAEMFKQKAAKRFAARNWLKTVRALMQFAVNEEMLADDPAEGIKNLSAKTDGYTTWSEADIDAFLARHPIGTREHLALALLIFTAQRRSDIVRMGPQHIRATPFGKVIDVRQNKTGAKLAIPVHPDLAAILDATPSGHLAFLATSQGRPFTAPGFTNWFRDACNAAGLPRGLSAHGLRKAACRRLAEAGCSVSQIAAFSGHKSRRELQRYTIAANQEQMARMGVESLMLARSKNEQRIGKPKSGFEEG
jgi:integrase